jgi:hypothetical protein
MASISVHAEKVPRTSLEGGYYGKVWVTIDGVAFSTNTNTFLSATNLAIKVIKALGLDKPPPATQPIRSNKEDASTKRDE